MTIPLQQGGESITILSILGKGGQATVYRVRHSDGRELALKCYHRLPSREFVHHLADVMHMEPITPQFRRPESVLYTSDKNAPRSERFGYFMPLISKGYVSMGDLLLCKAHFDSWWALTNACRNIAYAFMKLHERKLMFTDVNDGSFFFNTHTGEVEIVDCDNICPYDTYYAGMVRGKQRFVAPEIVRGGHPSPESDNFSVGLILFMLLTNGHPFEGRLLTQVPILTDRIEKIVYGRGIFVYDPKDWSNRPVPGIHSTLIARWKLLPDDVQKAFIRCFGDRIHRPFANEWFEIMDNLCGQVVACGNHDTLINLAQPESECSTCGCMIPRPLMLSNTHGTRLALMPGSKICSSLFAPSEMPRVIGEVVQNTENPMVWGIRNVSDSTMTVTMPDGKMFLARPHTGFPIYNHVALRWEGIDAIITDTINQ